VATVSVGQKTTIPGSAERDITEMKKDGFTEKDLLSAQAKTMEQIEIPKDTPIGYCFSYPAKCLIDGDAELIKWTKGVHIDEMEGKPIGKPLLDYLNKNTGNRFKSIKVLNDTITSLFAGLLNPGYDAYIGIIVGTGTNMAAFFPSEYIPKLKGIQGWHGETPVNLESGNFFPPHLTPMDDEVDAQSDNKGFQRFEKAVSGMYLGRIFRAALPGEKLDENLSAVDLSRMINNPFQYKEEYVETAYLIYERSARLVAASLSGLVQNLHAANPKIRRVQVLAEGSIGTPFRARLNMISGFPVFANQPFLKTLKHFILTDLGSHILDTARFLFGEADCLYCQTHQVHTDIAGEDVATVMLEMGGRTSVTCYLAYAENYLEQDHFPQTYIFIEGTEGSLQLGPDYWLRVTTKEGTLARRVPPPRYAWADPAYDVVHSSIVPCNADLLKALKGQGRAETTGEDNLKTVRLVFAAYDSAEKQQVIHF